METLVRSIILPPNVVYKREFVGTKILDSSFNETNKFVGLTWRNQPVTTRLGGACGPEYRNAYRVAISKLLEPVDS